MTNEEEFSHAPRILAGLLESRTGQQAAPNRFWRIQTSLKPVLAKYAIPDIDALVAVILEGDNEEIVQAAVEAMLNNESFFFRDTAMFSLLRRQVLPALQKRREAERKLRIWCVGCSTGQEAYSMAMMLADDAHGWRGWDVEVLATDISQRVLEKARQGRYTQFEIQRGLSVDHMLRYFRQEGEEWQIKDAIRDAVTFKRDNLLRSQLQPGRFDLILCRNVLMYFAPQTRHVAYTRLARSMRSDGFLMLGAAETVLGHTESFTASREYKGVYVPMVEANGDFEPRRAMGQR